MQSDERESRWDLLLTRVPRLSADELDGVASEILQSEGGRRHVESRLHHEDLSEEAWRLARWEVESRSRRGSSQWIACATGWLEAAGASWSRSASFCADVAWTARSVGNSALLHLSAQDIPSVPSTPGDRGLLHLLLQAQRYDFRYRAIRHTVAELGLRLAELDPFSRAIHTFALLAQNAPSAISEYEEVRRLAGGDLKVAHALLHGLWMATDLDDQANLILDLVESSEVLRDTDPIVALRKAPALRKLRRYDEALQSIDTGMLALSPSSVDIHQDFVRERAMVLVVRDIDTAFEQQRLRLAEESRRHVAGVVQAIDGKIDKIDDKIGDSLFKVVEILALFTAIVALLAAGAASVTIGSLEWWQRAVLMLVAGAIVMAFFIAIRIVVRPRRSSAD